MALQEGRHFSEWAFGVDGLQREAQLAMLYLLLSRKGPVLYELLKRDGISGKLKLVTTNHSDTSVSNPKWMH